MFKFVLKSGGHVDLAGKEYKKGDTITTPINLAEKFRNKFRLVSEDAVKPEKEPKIVSPEDVHSVEQESEDTTSTPASAIRNVKPTITKDDLDEESEYGEDVTDEFPIAKDVELQVFVKKAWYTVVDPENGNVESDPKLRKKAVNPFLEEYLEDEDEDLEDEDEE